jgi:hypothetical protein
MVGQNSEEKVEAEEEVECDLYPKRSQYLRRSSWGKREWDRRCPTLR